MAKAALEKATEKEEKGAWDKVKDTANDIKNKVVGKWLNYIEFKFYISSILEFISNCI